MNRQKACTVMTARHPSGTVVSQAKPVESHPFEPFLPQGAQMLFLGSFPPQPHRWSMPFYYPNWINDFWRIMGLIHFGDKDHFCIGAEKRFDEALIRQFCTDRGLAFYDTACEVRRLRDNASDAFLEVVTPTDIPALLNRIPTCHRIITTGEKATGVVAERFGCPVPAIGSFVEISRDVSISSNIPRAVSGGVSGGVSGDVSGGASIPSNIPINISQDISGIVPFSSNTPRDISGIASGIVSEIAPTSVYSAGSEGATEGIQFWRMPSTSRAYPLPLERKASFYRRLFDSEAVLEAS